MTVRVGMGVDAHRLGDDRPLMIGLVQIPHPRGLVGHSDGDVVAHALCDALLSASGGPDLGQLFPPGDPQWKDASGARLLGVVCDRLREQGATIQNAHAVVICEAPRLAPHRAAMQQALTALVGAPVTVHATTTDGMGFTGRGEGIACQAVALVEVP